MKKLSVMLTVLFFWTNPVFAEIVIGWAGQSLCEGMFSDNGVYVTPSPDTYQWYPASNSWGVVNGSGAREYANMMRAQTGQSIYMITGCVGGTTVDQWSDTSPGSVLSNYKAQVTASGKIPHIQQWNQGQAEYDWPVNINTYNHYYSRVTTFYSNILSTWGKTSAQLPLNVWVSGRASYGSSQAINAAQIALGTSLPGARLGTSYYDLNYVDGTHVDAVSYQIMGDRQARLDLKGLGVSSFNCSANPRILGGWRLNNYQIEVITDTPCGLHTHSWASTLTGWEVWNADFSWYIPIQYVYLTGSPNWWGTSIIIQLAASTGPNLNVYFWRDQYRSAAAPAFSNDTTLGVNGNPLAPLPFGLQTPN